MNTKISDIQAKSMGLDVSDDLTKVSRSDAAMPIRLSVMVMD